MNVHFRTNLDLTYHEDWPVLMFPPPIGSYVESQTGLELQVQRVTFKQSRNLITNQWETSCEVELHLGSAWEGRSIADFNKWERERKRRNRNGEWV